MLSIVVAIVDLVDLVSGKDKDDIPEDCCYRSTTAVLIEDMRIYT